MQHLFTYSIKGEIFDFSGYVFTAAYTIDYNNSVIVAIQITPNDDGSANWQVVSNELYKFKTINGEEILGEGNITIGSTSDKPADNEIWYTTIDGNTITSNYTFNEGMFENTNAQPANITSDTYVDGKGVLTFDSSLRAIFYMGEITNLETLTLPDTIEVLETYVLYNCTNLKKITISSESLLEHIKMGAFMGCNVLNLYFNKQTPSQVSSNVFDGDAPSLFRLYVPMEYVDEYKNVWSLYEDKIYGVVLEKEDLIPGVNIKTINGESILGEGDLNLIPNLKTINNQSLLGSGNITIEGGGSNAYSEVNHSTSDTTFTLTPNTFHVWDEVASLTLTFGSETSGVANEYLFQFTSGSTATTLSLPSDIKWANDSAPTIEPNMTYQISILKGLASYLGFSKEPELFPMNLTTPDSGYREPDELSIALADYILTNNVFDGVQAHDCSIPPNSLFIDGHEVSSFSSMDGGTFYKWYFTDGYNYGYLMYESCIYVSGANKGRMHRYDDD